MAIYLVMNIGILGVLPWKEVINHKDYLGSEVLEITWGRTAALIFTGLIVITAFASVFTGLLGGSRVPFNAARDKLFLPIFGRLHPRLNFPHVAVSVMCIITAIGSLFDLGTIINMLTAVMVLVQCIGQVLAFGPCDAGNPICIGLTGCSCIRCRTLSRWRVGFTCTSSRDGRIWSSAPRPRAVNFRRL